MVACKYSLTKIAFTTRLAAFREGREGAATIFLAEAMWDFHGYFYFFGTRGEASYDANNHEP